MYTVHRPQATKRSSTQCGNSIPVGGRARAWPSKWPRNQNSASQTHYHQFNWRHIIMVSRCLLGTRFAKSNIHCILRWCTSRLFKFNSANVHSRHAPDNIVIIHLARDNRKHPKTLSMLTIKHSWLLQCLINMAVERAKMDRLHHMQLLHRRIDVLFVCNTHTTRLHDYTIHCNT